MATPPSEFRDLPMDGPFPTLKDLWLHAVALHSTKALLCSDEDGSSFSYSDANEVVSLISARLAASGITRGDRVCIVSPFHPEAAFVFWGATAMGAVVVPIDYHLPPGETARLCAQVEPSLIFCDRDRATNISRNGVPVVIFDDETAETMPGESCSEWLHGRTDDSCSGFRPAQDDQAVVLFTSGTSSGAKGVVLSHGALCRSGWLMADSYGWQSGDILMNLGEMHTMSGLRNPCVAAVNAGCSFVVATPQARSNALLVSRIIERRQATILCCVPSMLKQFNRLSGHISRNKLAGMRMVLCTGSSLPVATAAAFEECYGVPVMNYYGLTETAGLCVGVIPRAAWLDRGSIGIPLGCRVRIVDNTGEQVRDGETGELLIMSDQLMSGYWRDPQLTQRVFRDGWFRTRDLVKRGPDGTLTLIDRCGESFKDHRGEFVSPADIEQAMELHPLVHEAGVCGYTTVEGEDAIAAFVVPVHPMAEWEAFASELQRFVSERLGPGWAPSRIERIDTLPRGTNDKLLRRILKELCRKDG